MAEHTKAIHFAELEYGDDCVRVDWISDPAAQRNKQDRQAFQVPILISVCDNSPAHNIRLDIPQRLITISVDALPAIWVGSLWRYGRRLRAPGYLRTRDLAITFAVGPEQWVGMDGTKTELGIEYPIPKGEIPIIRKGFDGSSSGYWSHIKNTQLLMISSGADFPNVLIPAIELARFYACTSSVLARHLFAGTWPKLEYAPHSEEAVVDGRAKIGVDNILHMDRLSGIGLARYKFSSAMARQVNRAGQYLSYPDRRKRQFRFGFPFDNHGESAKISCQVVDFKKWNKDDNKFDAYLLVTRIKSCFQRLPFNELDVEFRVSAEKRHVDDPSSLEEVSIGHRPIDVGSSSEETSPSEEAAKKASPDPSPTNIEPDTPNAVGETTTLVDQDERFKALDYSKVRLLSTKTEQRYRSVRKGVPIDGTADGTSTNPGKGTKGSKTEAQVKTDTIEQISSDAGTLVVFYEALKALRFDEEFAMVVESVRTRVDDFAQQCKFRTVYVFPLRLLTDDPSKWLVQPHDEGDGKGDKPRSRVLLLAHVVFRSGVEYLVGEIERVKGSEHFSIFCAKLDENQKAAPNELMVLVANEVAKRHGWPKYDGTNSLYVVDQTTLVARRLFHSDAIGEGKEYARRVASLEQI